MPGKLRKGGSGGGSQKSAAAEATGSSSSSMLDNSLVSEIIPVQERATEGVSGAASAYPYADVISDAFGLDTSDLGAHFGAEAVQANEDMHSESFAMQDDVAFSGTPSLWLAAHEAAHSFEQQAGIGVAGGVGEQGDSGEQLANAAADRVVSGQSAADLLPSQSEVSSDASESAVQFFREETTDDGRTIRISDDGNMVVDQYISEFDDGSQAQYGTHDWWSSVDPTSWDQSLSDAGSVVGLDTEGWGADEAPVEGADNFEKIEASNKANKTEGEDFKIWADCGRSARDVMGAGKGTGKNYGDMTAVYNKERDASFWEKLDNYWEGGEWNGNLKINEEKETAASSPAAMKREILEDLLGKNGVAKYEAMSEDERLAFDAKAGINRSAAPEVGEGYTMASHGNSYAVENERDEFFDKNDDGLVDQWNFHWAGVVGKSGGDTVSLENYATGDAEDVNKDWEHQMYGSEEGQTFYDQHKATKQHGDMPFAFRVRNRDP